MYSTKVLLFNLDFFFYTFGILKSENVNILIMPQIIHIETLHKINSLYMVHCMHSVYPVQIQNYNAA